MAERLAMECRLWVSCVDPWKAAASSPRALPDLLQVLLELGERSAKSIAGGQLGANS
jgi:hypothetical protein